MVTFGPVALLIAEPEFAVRAPRYGRPIAEYIKSWEALLEPMFRDVESPEGERRLLITLAPNGWFAYWVLDAAGGDLTEETAFIAPSDPPVVPRTILRPVAFAVSYWVGPPRQTPPPWAPASRIVIPSELYALKDVFLRRGQESITLRELIDEYWR